MAKTAARKQLIINNVKGAKVDSSSAVVVGASVGGLGPASNFRGAPPQVREL